MNGISINIKTLYIHQRIFVLSNIQAMKGLRIEALFPKAKRNETKRNKTKGNCALFSYKRR
jgi:hypothetical protein